MKQFNDSVIYVRNGKDIPAIVLKSAVSHPRPDLAAGVQQSKLHANDPYVETLVLLFADPDNGPTLVNSGSTAKIALFAFAVKPWVEGAAFGWKEWGDTAPVETPVESPIIPEEPEGEPETPKSE